jgi:dihydrofolate reductase
MSDIIRSLIAAVAENGVIGVAGGMPWKLSTDMKRFKNLTMGKPVVMGRKTYDTIGTPLAGRVNIVVSHRPDFAPDGVRVAPSLTAGLIAAEETARASGDTEVMVIGGGTVYAAAIPLADRLYITHVETRPEGDVMFPAIDPAAWRAVSAERFPAGPRDSAPTTFVIYERLGGGRPVDTR